MLYVEPASDRFFDICIQCKSADGNPGKSSLITSHLKVLSDLAS